MPGRTFVPLPSTCRPDSTAPIRAKPLVMPGGVDRSAAPPSKAYGSWAAWIERSTDNGKTWTRHGPIHVKDPFPSLPARQNRGQALMATFSRR